MGVLQAGCEQRVGTARTGSQEPTTRLSSQFHTQGPHRDDLILATVSHLSNTYLHIPKQGLCFARILWLGEVARQVT